VLVDTTLPPCATAGLFTRAQSGKAGHFPAIAEAGVIPELLVQHRGGQCTQPYRQLPVCVALLASCRRLQLGRDDDKDLLDGTDDVEEPIRQFGFQLPEAAGLPPTHRQLEPIVATVADSHILQSLLLLGQGVALSAQAARALLLFGRNAHDTQNMFVAGEPTVQAAAKLPGIPAVRLHLRAIFVPVAWPDHLILDAHRLELAMQDIAEAACFIAADHALGALLPFSRLTQERLRCELLRGLRCLAVDLLHDDILPPVDVDSELDDLRFRFSLFM